MIVNLKSTIYDSIKDEYLVEIESKVIANFEREKKKNPLNLAFKYLNHATIKEILIGSIIDNKKHKFIENYRKSSILANYKIKNGPIQKVWYYVRENNIDCYSDLTQSEFYRVIREEIVKKYDNPLISEVIQNHKEFYKSFDRFEIMQSELKSSFLEIDVVCKKIFNYSLIKTELRTKVLAATKTNICPYCNRQFINTYRIEKGENRVIAQLDHFFPKNLFPLFALSLYNFVPSCAHCNSILKKEEIFDCAYPINNKSNTEIFFEIEIENYKQAKGFEVPTIKITKPRNADWDSLFLSYLYGKFCIESIYESHGEFVRWLNWKSNLYNGGYKKAIKKMLKNQVDYDLKSILFGYDGSEEELLTKPLSKLAHDVMPKKMS